uniref:Uncharacterized protein n=1 Tax=Cucumis melo TaxID=3656 RepID=A0A9I9E5Q6_CUCME
MKQFGDRAVPSHMSDEGSVSMHSVKAVYRIKRQKKRLLLVPFLFTWSFSEGKFDVTSRDFNVEMVCDTRLLGDSFASFVLSSSTKSLDLFNMFELSKELKHTEIWYEAILVIIIPRSMN